MSKILFPVIWNPWADQAREIADFGDDEYPNMVCVESGHVSSPVILLPGTAFEASQILQVSSNQINNFPQLPCSRPTEFSTRTKNYLPKFSKPLNHTLGNVSRNTRGRSS